MQTPKEIFARAVKMSLLYVNVGMKHGFLCSVLMAWEIMENHALTKKTSTKVSKKGLGQSICERVVREGVQTFTPNWTWYEAR